MRIILKIITAILLTTFFVYLPILAYPDLLLNRGNDLNEFFWPIIHYIKQNINLYQEIPFWNNMFFMGTPLISDPQNLFWYIPNAIFLITSIDVGIVLTFFLHTICGGIGMYLANKQFGLSKSASTFAACLFIASAKMFGYLEAGHFGLVLSFFWFPWVMCSIKKLVDKPNLFWAIVFSLSLSSIYFNHILTAVITIIVSGLLGIILFLEKPNKKTFLYTLLSLGVFLGIIFPALVSQNQWFPQTTRDLLLEHPDVYPKWNSKFEFAKNMVSLEDLNSEKIITLGVVTILLSTIGFLRLNNKIRIILIVLFAIIILISLNNASPIYSLLIKQDWYVMLRVSTRVWFILTLVSIVLASYGMDILLKKRKMLAYAICLLAIMESLSIGYKILLKPIGNSNHVPKEVYEFINTDTNSYRVFCTTRCLSQKQSSIYGIKLADGYGTLQQKNYYSAAKQIGQYYSDKYSLSIPPFDIFLYQQLQPHSPTLATYGIKYIISPHVLTDKNLLAMKKIDKYTIYKNTLHSQLNYILYTPNFIKVDNTKQKNTILVPEIYSSNWVGYDEFGNRLMITESSENILQVQTNGANVVTLRYMPYQFLDITDIMKE